MSRLKFLTAAGAVLLALGLSGCGPFSPGQPTTSNPATVPTPAPTITDYNPATPTPGAPGASTSVTPSPSSATPTTYTLIDTENADSPIIQNFSNMTDAHIAVAYVTVEGQKVHVFLCTSQQSALNSLPDCEKQFADIKTNPPSDFELLEGTRDGATAKVTGSLPFYWGTVYFDSSDPAATVTTFTMAADCMDQYGNSGTRKDRWEECHY